MKKASKYLYIFGGAFCLVSVVSTILTAIFLWIGGFIPGLVLGIVSIARGYYYPFIPVGVSVMGGLWIGAFFSLFGIVFPFITAVIALLGAFMKKGHKALAIINMVIAVLLLLKGEVILGMLILLASIFMLVHLSEEKEKAKQEVEQEKEAA